MKNFENFLSFIQTLQAQQAFLPPKKKRWGGFKRDLSTFSVGEKLRKECHARNIFNWNDPNFLKMLPPSKKKIIERIINVNERKSTKQNDDWICFDHEEMRVSNPDSTRVWNKIQQKKKGA